MRSDIMLELIQQNPFEIVSVIMYVLGVGVVGRIRSVSDKNILSNFDTVKQLTKKVSFKEMDITNSLSVMNTTIDRFQNDMMESQKALNETIAEFQDSDFVNEMKSGLANLKELHEQIENRDQIIQSMMTEYKKVTKDLAEIKNKLGV